MPSQALSRGDVCLFGAQETLLATLFARAIDAESSDSILSDHTAVRTVRRLRDEFGYDFKRVGGGSFLKSSAGRIISARALQMDVWTTSFLERNPGPATVLHLACGMDTRSSRVKWQGPGRLWIDCDVPEVVELREKIMEKPAAKQGICEYRLLAARITDGKGWLANIPSDRPTIIVMEGLSMYLTAEEFYTLLRRMMAHFGKSDPGRLGNDEMVFDAVDPISMRVGNMFFLRMTDTGAQLKFGLNDRRELETQVRGLKLTEAANATKMIAAFDKFPLLAKLLFWVLSWFQAESGNLRCAF